MEMVDSHNRDVRKKTSELGLGPSISFPGNKGKVSEGNPLHLGLDEYEITGDPLQGK